MDDPAVPSPPATAPRKRRRLSAGRRALFAFVPLVVIGTLTEGSFSIRERWREGRKEQKGALLSPREPDRYRGNVLIPGKELKVQGRVQRINALGMRGPEVPEAKAAGERRVLCVGGSTTFGLFVSSNERTWPARTEARLREFPGRASVTVWNGGCPAWDARTSFVNLRLRLYEQVQPDVIVACHAYNDVVANLDPQYVAASEKDEPVANWLGTSALVRFLLSRYGPEPDLENKKEALGEAGLVAYRKNLERLITQSRARGAKVVLCTEPSCFRPTLAQSVKDGVPGLEQWYHDLSPFLYPTLVAGLARYNAMIRQVAKDTGCPLVDLEQLMPDDVTLFETPVHHSDAGEERVAREVAKVLHESGVLD